LRWHFHFAPDVAVALHAADAFEVRAGDVNLHMTLPAQLTWTLVPGWYSPSYGVRKTCTMLDLDAVVSVDGRCRYAFQLTSR
jgi:hypothetical protein